MHQTLSADVLPKLINTVVNFTIIFVSTVIIVLFKTNGLVFNPASETKGLCNLTKNYQSNNHPDNPANEKDG